MRAGLWFGFGDAACRFRHHRGGRIDIEVRGDSASEGLNQLDLGDDVEAAPDMALKVESVRETANFCKGVRELS